MFFSFKVALNEAKKINQSVVYNTQTEFDLAINTIIKLIDVIKKIGKVYITKGYVCINNLVQ